MLDDYTKELPESWDDPSVGEWKAKAKEIIKNYYLAFRGHQWHLFNLSKERKLLRAQVCYALFGPPSDPVTEGKGVEDAYGGEQRKRGEELVDQIIDVVPDKAEIRVSFLVIACKQEDKEFSLPIISIFKGNNVEESSHAYLDSQGRTYKNWSDWKDNNALPMLKYAYPTDGYLTCVRGEYVFDETKDPCVSFGTSPQCELSKRVLRQTDMVTSLTSLASGGVMIASLFTPIGPAVLLGSGIVGGVSALYGTSRGVARLVDKGTHGQSLTDLESWTIWISVAALPLHTVTSVVNFKLVQGAVDSGRIFTSNIRLAATMLNFTTLGVDGAMLTLGLANLYEKQKADQLGPLDVLQFTMSLFFFTNTLIQPKVASSIIKQAQENHLGAISQAMTDRDAQAAFQKFAEQNKGDGGIGDTSKLVRAVNKIHDPEAFFKTHQGADSIEIGGRKGKTLLVQDQIGNKFRINAQKVIPKNVQRADGYQLKAGLKNKLAQVFDEKEIEDIQLNEKNIFKEMDYRQKSRYTIVFGKSARKCNKDIIKAAYNIAEDMGLNTVDDFMSMVEIVAAHVEAKHGTDLTQSLNFLTGDGKQDFIKGLFADVEKARDIANCENLNIADRLMAVYHYRKHGHDFPSKMDSIVFYLKEVPKKIFQDQYLCSEIRFQDGVQRRFYVLRDDRFGIVTLGKDGCPIISTMYRKANEFANVQGKLKNWQEACAQNIEELSWADLRHAYRFGFKNIFVSIDGRIQKPLQECEHLGLEEVEEMARQLRVLHMQDDEGFEDGVEE